MRLHNVLSLVVAMTTAVPLIAQNSTDSIAIFASGVRHGEGDEFDGVSVHSTRWIDGGIGIGFERRLSKVAAFEASVEYRRDAVFRQGYGTCNDQYHGTCILYHRIQLTSMPATVLARRYLAISERMTLFGSIGARYVGAPSQHDLTASRLHQPSYAVYSVATESRLNPEIALGGAWRPLERLSLFAEGHLLMGSSAEWDPRRRLNAGVRWRF